jgi:hypothetical protein
MPRASVYTNSSSSPCMRLGSISCFSGDPLLKGGQIFLVDGAARYLSSPLCFVEGSIMAARCQSRLSKNYGASL